MTLVAEEVDARAGELGGELKVIEAELEDVQSRLLRLYEALEKSDLTLEALSPRILSLRHREDQLAVAREEAAAQLASRKVELPTTEEIKEYVADFRSFLIEGTIPDQKALIRNFVQGIEVVGDEATLRYTGSHALGRCYQRGGAGSPVSSVSRSSLVPTPPSMFGYRCLRSGGADGAKWG